MNTAPKIHAEANTKTSISHLLSIKLKPKQKLPIQFIIHMYKKETTLRKLRAYLWLDMLYESLDFRT